MQTIHLGYIPLFRKIVRTPDSLSVLLADTMADPDCHQVLWRPFPVKGRYVRDLGKADV